MGWAERGGQRNETEPLPIPCTIRKGPILLAAKPSDRPRVPSMGGIARGGHVPEQGTGDIAWDGVVRAPRRTPRPSTSPPCVLAVPPAPHIGPGCRQREPAPAPLISGDKPRSAPAVLAPSPTPGPPLHPRDVWACTPAPPAHPAPLCTPCSLPSPGTRTPPDPNTPAALPSVCPHSLLPPSLLHRHPSGPLPEPPRSLPSLPLQPDRTRGAGCRCRLPAQPDCTGEEAAGRKVAAAPPSERARGGGGRGPGPGGGGSRRHWPCPPRQTGRDRSPPPGDSGSRPAAPDGSASPLLVPTGSAPSLLQWGTSLGIPSPSTGHPLAQLPAFPSRSGTSPYPILGHPSLPALHVPLNSPEHPLTHPGTPPCPALHPVSLLSPTTPYVSDAAGDVETPLSAGFPGA